MWNQKSLAAISTSTIATASIQKTSTVLSLVLNGNALASLGGSVNGAERTESQALDLPT